MNIYRNTYVKIDYDNIKYNVSKIINEFNNYEYYFGVVKANCYGHGLKSIKFIIDGGCNYLVVAMLEEALEIRKMYKDIPILCLGIIDKEFLEVAYKNNITITVNSYEYAKKVKDTNLNLKVHIKINSGMNRLGISSKEEFNKTYNLLKGLVEGIYTHIYDAENEKTTNNQVEKYKDIISIINKDEVKIFHIAASEALINYEKLDFVNGCRLGIIMYGFTDSDIKLKSTFSLHSHVVQINKLKKGDTLGYNGTYIAKDDEYIAVIPIGYADGIIRANKGRYVYINNNRYQIVGNICMDMLFVKIDDTINIDDEVLILKDNNHINDVSKHLNTIPYEVMSLISFRVPRI